MLSLQCFFYLILRSGNLKENCLLLLLPHAWISLLCDLGKQPQADRGFQARRCCYLLAQPG